MTGTAGITATAVILGTAFGLGVWCLLALTPRWAALPLSRRIVPYIRDIADSRGATPWGAGAGAGLVHAGWASARARLGGMLGGADAVTRRLHQAGWAMGASAFRGRQLAAALVGVAAGGAVIVALALLGRMTPAAALLPVVLAPAGLLLCDLRLTVAARRRVARVQEELPTVLEFLALCLAAGEGLLDSLRRVAQVGAGELTSEVRGVVLEVGTGAPLGEALSAMARRVDLPALSRSTEHLVAALDRGAPLAQVLQAQAIDAREDARRGLIEQAGRKEILMLIPLVFAVLPLSVVFAIFPGIFMLRLGFG